IHERLKKRLGLNVAEKESPLGNPCFGLKTNELITQEQANPLVSPHLVVILEAVGDEPINCLSQSQKWRESYSRDLCVPMIMPKSLHYYIYKPLQLLSGVTFDPIHFYQQSGTIS
ncbi:hypothetical protein DFH28DRAFT_909357, partial [Melampsora americana]